MVLAGGLATALPGVRLVWRFLVYGLRIVFLYGHLRALLRFSFTPVFSMPMGHKIIGLLFSLIVPVFWLYRE